MGKPEKAVEIFKKGYSCSQAVLSAYGTELGLNEDICLKIAQGFGAGIGRSALICGAVTGAYMVIGLTHGSAKADDRDAKEKVYTLVREFKIRFEEHNHTCICYELLGCDIGTVEGFREALQKDFINVLCPQFVMDAAEILEEIL